MLTSAKTVEAIIQAKFKKCPGYAKVQSGEYELFEQITGYRILESNFFELVPGSYIMMSFIMGRYHKDDSVPELPDSCTRVGCRRRSAQVIKINSETMKWYVRQKCQLY